MIIVSKFKDYYDHIGYVYGQDPGIQYRRMGAEPEEFTSSGYNGKPYTWKGHTFSIQVRTEPELNRLRIPSEFRWNRKKMPYDEARWYTDWICVAGVVYPVVGRRDSTRAWDLRLSEKEKEEARAIKPTLVTPNHPLWEAMGEENQRNLAPYTSAAMTDIQIKAQMPVLRLDNPWTKRDWFTIECEVPVLAEYGFPGVVDAGHIWQEISHFVVNVMRGHPDALPASSQTNNDKIQAAGFDLKQSFRHRKTK